MRLPETTYVYDDPEHPDRVTREVSSPAYTAEDRALLLGLEHAEREFNCQCGEPIDEAWHSDMDGWYERVGVVCHACTALAPEPEKGAKEPVVHFRVINTRPDSKPLAPFVFGETTTAA